MGLRLMRNLDFVLLALALPVFLAAGFPLLGWGAGTGAYLAQRGVRAWAVGKAKRSDDLRTTVGLLAGNLIARGWLVALTIFGAGMVKSQAGVASAVLFLLVFTTYASMNLMLAPLDKLERTP